MKDYWFFQLSFSNTLALFAAVLLILSALLVRADAQRKDGASYLRPQHRAMVEKWLTGKPNLRLATEADNVNKKEMAISRAAHKNYQPYYAVGDFNRDGKEDFAVALINKHKRRDRFALAIFNGSLGNNSRPAYFEEGYELTSGDISFGEIDANEDVRQERLVAGAFNSDNSVILKPRAKGYVVQACIEE